MDYAAVLYFDNTSERIIQDYITLAAQLTDNRYMLDHSIPPHITVAGFDTNASTPVMNALASISRRLSAGAIQFESVASFELKVIYIKPASNDYLLDIASQVRNQLSGIVKMDPLYMPPMWVPHAALAVQLSQNAYNAAMPNITQRFTPFSGQAERLALVRCNPYLGMDIWRLRG